MSTSEKVGSKPRHVLSIIAACETLLQEGRKPSPSQYRDIVGAIRGGANPNWEAFPLTRTWFSQY